MSPAQSEADLCVLLTPREMGGHEVALLGWLHDAVSCAGLRPAIVAPSPALAQACAERGLSAWATAHGGGTASRMDLLGKLIDVPARRPVLLAPGVLHAQAWLLAAALLLRRCVWVYVPMTHTAVQMGYSVGGLRDRLLAPWLRRVHGWIVIDERQAQQLRTSWRVQAPVHVLPNVARLAGAPPAPAATAEDGCLRVAFVGRFDLRQKGLDWLISVLRDQPAWSRRCHWRFQGRGPGERALLELASALGPQHATVCPHGPMDAALAHCDVLLLTSRYEGVPLVALEATARGWPVVATRRCGLDALLPSTSLFDFGDVQGLADALASLETPAARRDAVHHARQRVQLSNGEGRYRRALQRLVPRLRGASTADLRRP